MRLQFNSRYWLLSAAIIVVSIFVLAWAGNPQNTSTSATQVQDTIPPKKSQNERRPEDKDFDKELRDLDEAGRRLEGLKDKDWNKIQRDVEEQLKKIDVEKIRLDAEEALKKVDMEKIGRELEEALRNIDFKKIEQDIEAAMSEVSKIDKEKMRQEMQRAAKEVEEKLEKKEWRKEMEELKKINMDEIRKEMEKVKVEMSRVHENLKMEKINMQETMANAQVEIDKAREELRGYQEMVYSMEKDALLNTKEDYTIEYKQGELSINGKKQPSQVTDKYKKYFRKDAITIKKEDGSLDIDMD